MLLAIFIVLAAGCSGATETNAGLPEVRNNGTAIQWRYGSESEWQDLVMLSELTGAAGEKGADGRDGADGKSVEVRSADSYIQWRYTGGEWQDLVALADISGPSGQNGADGVNGKTPEFRVNENALQWRYTGEEIWLNLYDLSALKGLDGKDGINGIDGEKGDKGDKGEDGKDGSCSGYFHASNRGTSASFNQPLQLFEDCNSGGLFVWDRTNRTVTLKAGHTYSISFSGSVCISHDMGGWYSVVLKGRQGILNDTLIERYMNDADNSRVWMPFAFNRIYSAGSDIVLQYEFIQLTPGTQLNGAVYNLTIIALD